MNMRGYRWALTACAFLQATQLSSRASQLQVARYGLITFDDVASPTEIGTHYPGVTFDVVTSGPGNLWVEHLAPDGEPSPVYAIQVLDKLTPVACSASPLVYCPPTGNSVTPLAYYRQPTAAFPGTQVGLRATFGSPKTWVSIATRPSFDKYAVTALGDGGTNPPINDLPFLEAFDASGNYLHVEAVYPYAFGDASWGRSCGSALRRARPSARWCSPRKQTRRAPWCTGSSTTSLTSRNDRGGHHARPSRSNTSRTSAANIVASR
jgi:hypothetical protein